MPTALYRFILAALLLLPFAAHASDAEDFINAFGLSGSEVGGFQAEGVVLVFSDVFFVGRGFVGGLSGAMRPLILAPRQLWPISVCTR